MVFVSNKGELQACDITQDKKLWRHIVDANKYGKTSIAFHDERLFAGDTDGNVFCIYISSGNIKWEKNLGRGEKDTNGMTLLDYYAGQSSITLDDASVLLQENKGVTNPSLDVLFSYWAK